MKKAVKPKATPPSRDLITQELIPYACHYSPESILTKNGELIQTIKLTYGGGENDHNFRETLRASLIKHLDASKFAVWVHTARLKNEVKSYDEGDYLQYVDYLWRQHLPTEIHFINEIYISVVIDSTQFEPWKMRSYLRSLSKKAEETFRNEQMEEKNELLNTATDGIVSDLFEYNAQKLGLYAQDDVYYTEMMEFVRSIIGVNYAQMPLPLSDLSVNVKPRHIEFNTYTGMFIVGDGKTRKYGAVISLKEGTGITAPALQQLMNSGTEFIISQAIDFAWGNRYLPAIREQLSYNSVSHDKNFLASARLDKAEVERPESYVLQQSSLLVIKNSPAELTASVELLQKNMQDLGLVAYLEDINSERVYWSCLPGNFAYLKRQSSMPRRDIGTYAVFGVDKYSAVEDCLFGRPVTFLELQDQEVFPLHFLSNGQGHMLVVGPDESKRQMFANLIAVQAARNGAQIIFYDHYLKYPGFSSAANAEYITKLDLDFIATKLNGSVKIIILNSIQPILDAGGHDAFCEFLEFAGSKNSIVIVCEQYENNCELLLSNFTTMAFFPIENVTEPYADNYDIFEDEKQTIESLSKDFIYARHGYEELVFKFTPSEETRHALLEGRSRPEAAK